MAAIKGSTAFGRGLPVAADSAGCLFVAGG
jgi:hypothetical protein